jgi:catechol 2,3-dioxygenase-like lactoylglutathione lyase family enzyme
MLRAMDQRISLITLGYRDYARARAFYAAMGWTDAVAPDDEVVFFQAGGMVFALWDRAKLAEDSAVPDAGGWGGITVAYNVRSPDEVDAVLAQAQAAGGTVGRPGAKTPWGGYSGVFVDPEGHPWEVAHNPAWTVRDDGTVSLGG